MLVWTDGIKFLGSRRFKAQGLITTLWLLLLVWRPSGYTSRFDVGDISVRFLLYFVFFLVSILFFSFPTVEEEDSCKFELTCKILYFSSDRTLIYQRLTKFEETLRRYYNRGLLILQSLAP